MKERPIIFTPENGQKIHEGTKTQTRRILKSQPWEGLGRASFLTHYSPTRVDKKTGDEYPGEEVFGVYDADGEWGCICPFGRPGDRLWIREALYRKGDVMTYLDGSEVTQDDLVMPSWGEKKTIPSIHMPRWACRTVVEITEIRVERVQDISEEDAKAEGVSAYYGIMKSGNLVTETNWTVVEEFKKLWESINGPGSWEKNEWVWALKFKHV